MEETLYSSKEFISNLKKNLLDLYKLKFNFKKTHIFLKLFYNQDFILSVDNYFLDVFDCMNYEIKIKKYILDSLKSLKGLTEEQYDLVYSLSYDFEKYENVVIKKIIYITNLIKAYNGGYSFFYSENSSEDIVLSKSIIKDKLEKIGF